MRVDAAVDLKFVFRHDRIDAAIAAHKVWLVEPVVPGDASSLIAAEVTSEFFKPS